MITYQKLTGRWSTNADVFIAVTEFARAKLIQGGLPAERIRVKPNFVAKDRGVGDGGGGHLLYVGRLSHDKGLETIFQAWEGMDRPLSLHIVGDGPMRAELERRAAKTASIIMRGFIPIDQVFEEMKEAVALVFPSLNYEGFPRTIVEAFSVGLPVIASDLGSIATIVTHGSSGLLFPAGDPSALCQAVMQINNDARLLNKLREGSRKEYETRFNAEKNYARLMEIYEYVLDSRTGVR
jgi:glycosyltransferase involved in cell wall biosynthesis